MRVYKYRASISKFERKFIIKCYFLFQHTLLHPTPNWYLDSNANKSWDLLIKFELSLNPEKKWGVGFRYTNGTCRAKGLKLEG
jgi:hypothetical protein